MPNKLVKTMSTVMEPMPGARHVPAARKWRALVAEFIGTMFFVFFVAGSVAVPAGLNGDAVATLLFIGLTQGLALATLVAVTANLSGGHLNPAVTLALVVTRAMSAMTGILYMIAQLSGAIAGAALYLATMGTDGADKLGITTPTNFQGGNVYLFEFVLTSVLLLVVFATAVHSSVQGHVLLAPIPIGMTVTIAQFIAARFTGASLNPARTFGPAVIASSYSDAGFAWKEQYLYWLAQFSAAIVVGLLYKSVFLSAPITRAQARDAGLLGHSDITIKGMSEADLIRFTARDESAYVLDIPDADAAPQPHRAQRQAHQADPAHGEPTPHAGQRNAAPQPHRTQRQVHQADPAKWEPTPTRSQRNEHHREPSVQHEIIEIPDEVPVQRHEPQPKPADWEEAPNRAQHHEQPQGPIASASEESSVYHEVSEISFDSATLHHGITIPFLSEAKPATGIQTVAPEQASNSDQLAIDVEPNDKIESKRTPSLRQPGYTAPTTVVSVRPQPRTPPPMRAPATRINNRIVSHSLVAQAIKNSGRHSRKVSAQREGIDRSSIDYGKSREVVRACLGAEDDDEDFWRDRKHVGIPV